MAHTTRQPVLKMEIGDIYVCTQHLVGVGEVRICLIEVGPYGGLVATIIKHCDEFRVIQVDIGGHQPIPTSSS
jgi:hypothetical protein